MFALHCARIGLIGANRPDVRVTFPGGKRCRSPPTARVLVVIRDGIARGAAAAPPLAPGDYVLALALPQDLVLLDRMFGPRLERNRPEERGLLGEFAFDGTTTLAAIVRLYDPAAETDGARCIAGPTRRAVNKLGGHRRYARQVVEIVGSRRSLQVNLDLFSWRCRAARRPIRENATRFELKQAAPA